MTQLFRFTRYNQHRYQENTMTCTKPCDNCQCKKSTSPYESDYIEIDPSPLATQARKMFEEKK